MRKLIPFLLVSAGLFAIVGVLFLMVRNDAIPTRMRGFEWRKAVASTPVSPVEDETA